MSLIFADSYDHYTDLNQKWSSAGFATIERAGVARTGPGNLRVAGSFGPTKAFVQRNTVILGTAFWPVTAAAHICEFHALSFTLYQLLFDSQADLSVGVFRNDGFNNLIAQSAPNVLVASGYNYVEIEAFASLTVGTIVVKVNGAIVLNLSGIRTVSNAGHVGYNGIQLMGGGTFSRHDDTYVCDTVAPNGSFLGAVQIYAEVPNADAAPLQWTPSVAGDHFPLVNSIPPDVTKFVQSNTVGQIDEYSHPVTGIPPSVFVLATQHSLDAQLDSAGSHSIASTVDEVAAGAGTPLATANFMVVTPYDVDPVTGLPWVLTDIPTRRIGVELTA
jgi:hypothetical protein